MGGWGCHPQGPTQAGLPLRLLEHGWGARAPSGHLRHLLYLWLNPSQRFVCLVRTSKGETGDKGPGLPLGQLHQLRPFRRGLPQGHRVPRAPPGTGDPTTDTPRTPTQTGRPVISLKAQTAKRQSLEPCASPRGLQEMRGRPGWRSLEASPSPQGMGRAGPAALSVHTDSPSGMSPGLWAQGSNSSSPTQTQTRSTGHRGQALIGPSVA